MTRTRASASFALATAFVGATITSGMLATPIANAAPLDAVRAAVVNERTGAACGALNYNIDLEGEAQALIGNTGSTSKPGNYKGVFITRRGQGDPQSEAIEDLIAKSLNAIKNCSYIDFGVGFFRPNLEDGPDYVSIALGQAPEPVPVPAPVPVPVPVPAPAPAPVDEPLPLPDSITMDVVSSGLGKVDVNFTNSSAVAATCDYVATPNGIGPTVTRTVQVKANGTGVIRGLTDPRPLLSYHLAATCTGTVKGASVPLGNPQTDI